MNNKEYKDFAEAMGIKDANYIVKQYRAYQVANMKASELTKEDRKYYGIPGNRGRMDITNDDGSVAINIGYYPISSIYQLEGIERSAYEYRLFVQDMLYRKFIGYDMPFFRSPEKAELKGIYNQVCLEMGLEEYILDRALPAVEIVSSIDNNIIDANIIDAAEQQHPEDSENGYVVTLLSDMSIDTFAHKIAKVVAADIGYTGTADELLKTYEFGKLLDSIKQIPEAILTGQKIHGGFMINSYKRLVKKYADNDTKSALSKDVSELVNMIHVLNDYIGNVDCESINNISTEDFSAILNKITSDDYIKFIATIFENLISKDVAKSIVAYLNANKDSVDALINKVRDAVADDNIVATIGRAKGDADKITQDERIEERTRANNPHALVPDSASVTNRRLLKSYPELDGFRKLLREDQKVNFGNYHGLVVAEVSNRDDAAPAGVFYIDPAKINPYFSVVIPRSGSNFDLNPLYDIYCEFENADRLVQHGQYSETDWHRDNNKTIINRSFFSHVDYKGIPKNDLPIVVGKMKPFTDVLDSNMCDIRFKVSNYESPEAFTLTSGKTSLSYFASANKFYDGLVLDVRFGSSGANLFRASGTNARRFAERINKFCRSNVIDLDVSDEEFAKHDAERLQLGLVD